jgi:hypothetical protein
MTLRVLGDDRALALAGLAGDASGNAPTVRLGETAEPADVVWLAGPASAPAPPGARLVATGGDGLWSCAPWPARDDLFELPPPPTGGALVVCADGERRAFVVERLQQRGRPVTGAAELRAEDLAGASVVALLGDAGAASDRAPWAASAMPAEAPAVLAARRALIAPRCATTFGLLPGIDHLAFGAGDDVVQYADTVLSFPRSFDPFRVLGAVAAERHRASRVYERLAAELGAERAGLRSARRSAAPRG